MTAWKRPVPSTHLDAGLQLKDLGGRVCVLRGEYEKDEAGEMIPFELRFEGVESYMCTHFHACSVEHVEAFDTVLELSESDWVRRVNESRRNWGDAADPALRHLRIYIADGPCFEFVCRDFKVEAPKGWPIPPEFR